MPEAVKVPPPEGIMSDEELQQVENEVMKGEMEEVRPAAPGAPVPSLPGAPE
eukprot:COSAG01_NODE_27639_length_680_cov_2.628227_1_plen_51_part_10